MANTKQEALSIARLDANGRLTLPAEYRRALELSGGTTVMLIPVGGTLVIAPCDDAFRAVGERLEARMHEAGSNVEDLIQAAVEARTEIAREEFGVDAEE
jgi:AbrB family looped-hinge helix DNA binding protein